MRMRTMHAILAASGLWTAATTSSLTAAEPAGVVRISDGKAPVLVSEPNLLPGEALPPGACAPVGHPPAPACTGATTAIAPAPHCCLAALPHGCGALGLASCSGVLGGTCDLLGKTCLGNCCLLGGGGCQLAGGHHADSDRDFTGAYYTYNPNHPSHCCNLALTMVNPFGGGTHSPDHGWSPPVKFPIYRVPVRYHRYWPTRWYGEPGSGIAPTAPRFPMVYMPTDTTQLGFYYQRVPQWRPDPTMLPPLPNPANFHTRMPAPDSGMQSLGDCCLGCCPLVRLFKDDDESKRKGDHGLQTIDGYPACAPYPAMPLHDD